MKGKVRVTINRDTLKELLQAHVSETMLSDFELKEFTVHRNSSVELVIEQRQQEPALPLGEADAGNA